MNNLSIFVAGAAASGKSTLCEGLSENLPAYFYKPSKAYFDIAAAKNIPLDNAFQLISQDEVIDYLCNIYLTHDIVVGDQHLSIQPERDSAFAVNRVIDFNKKEPYVAAINHQLFIKMQSLKISSFVIYLKASAEKLYERAHLRNLATGFPIRNTSIEEVLDELEAEEFYLNQLINRLHLQHMIINTDNLGPQDVLDCTMTRILKIRKEGNR